MARKTILSELKREALSELAERGRWGDPWIKILLMNNKQFFNYAGDEYKRVTGRKLSIKKISEWFFVKPRTIEEYRFEPDKLGSRILPDILKRITYLELYRLNAQKSNTSKAKKLASNMVNRWKSKNISVEISRERLVEIYERAIQNDLQLSLKNKNIPANEKNIQLSPRISHSRHKNRKGKK